MNKSSNYASYFSLTIFFINYLTINSRSRGWSYCRYWWSCVWWRFVWRWGLGWSGRWIKQSWSMIKPQNEKIYTSCQKRLNLCFLFGEKYKDRVRFFCRLVVFIQILLDRTMKRPKDHTWGRHKFAAKYILYYFIYLPHPEELLKTY